jgi:hypothetical protein
MRILFMLLSLVAMSATAAAQKVNPAVGPCAGADDALDSATKASLVAKPDHKPHRQDNGIMPVATDMHFRMLTQTDVDQNFESGAPRKWVIATGIVDTTGRIDPKTAVIKESSSVGLSHAVCDAWVKMAFAPATLHGQKVPAPYQERFIFEQSVTDINSSNPNNPAGGDRH